MGKIKKLRYTNRILSMFVVVFIVSAVAMIGIAAACHDWGDAPDPTYPTKGWGIGASHGNSPSGYYLGDSVDWDGWGGHQSADATGDDNYDTDDEDGVTFTSSLTAGSQATVQVTAHVPQCSTGGYLNAWVDFNGDGDWADTGEQIFTDVQLAAGLNTLTFNVPSDATTGTTFARFRSRVSASAAVKICVRSTVEMLLVAKLKTTW
jgi:hypothetical protein